MDKNINSYESPLEKAQEEFRNLFEKDKSRALWFMRDSVSVDIIGPDADIRLESIARNGLREIWLEVRRLLKWRFSCFLLQP